MLELSEQLGAGTLATGHYARVVHDADSGEPLLRSAADHAKDQSYVLCGLEPRSLARLRFPLGEMHKPQVRALAAEAGLGVARRRDSQDLCFLAGTRSRDFLERHAGLGARPGPILDLQGAVLGEHTGSHLYTVGQRHGLRISAPEPLYVLATDASANTVTVGPRSELVAERLDVEAVTLRRSGEAVDGVRVRAHGRTLRCRLPAGLAAGAHERVEVELGEPAERTAPGQIACLYAGDVVVGFGTIAA